LALQKKDKAKDKGILRKLILIAASLTITTAFLANKPNVQKLEFEPIIIQSSTNNGNIDIFSVFDDNDNLNRKEMNQMLDEIWPAASPRPSR
tara:strand:- start:4612 stop:4887 length:276 start_codon:yes stop_codon:yes gene_type:complete